MTEDEARNKYCPMGGRKVSSKSGELSIGGFTECIASDCMMWVDDTKTVNVTILEGEQYEYSDIPEDEQVPAGRCGLTRR